MKNASLLIVCIFCLVGCMNKKKSSAAQSAPSFSPDTVSTTSVLDHPPVSPAVYKRYYVGMTGSGDTVRAPGWIVVRERAEHWNRNGGMGGTLSGPNTEYRDASYSPDPLPYEIRDAVAQANDTMRALSEENARLTARLTVLTTTSEAPVAPIPPAAPTQSDSNPAESSNPLDPALNGTIIPELPQAGAIVRRVQPRAERTLLRSFRPNPDGLIEISPEFAYRPPGSPRVPFQQIYFPKVQIQEVKFQVSLLSPGPESSGVVNGKLVAPSDTLDGFAVDEINDEGMWFKRHYYRIWLPFAQNITVRYPL